MRVDTRRQEQQSQRVARTLQVSTRQSRGQRRLECCAESPESRPVATRQLPVLCLLQGLWTTVHPSPTSPSPSSRSYRISGKPTRRSVLTVTLSEQGCQGVGSAAGGPPLPSLAHPSPLPAPSSSARGRAAAWRRTTNVSGSSRQAPRSLAGEVSGAWESSWGGGDSGRGAWVQTGWGKP